jgi:hypothetical protein
MGFLETAAAVALGVFVAKVAYGFVLAFLEASSP